MADQKKAIDVKLEAYTKGMQSNYSHYIASPNSWSYLENFDTDRLGVLTTRPNIFEMGTLPSQVFGIVPYEKGTDIYWLIKAGTSCYFNQANLTGTGAIAANSITFSDAGALLRGDTCQGATVIASAGSNGVRLTLDGTNAIDFATVRLGMPNQVDLVVAGFVGRVWCGISNTGPASFIQDQLYYSDVIPASGIANTTGTGQYLKINTGGKFITGLVQFNNVLYVFTPDNIFRVYNTQSLDNAAFANVGAIRQECIVKTADAIYFLHFSGVYRLDGSGVTKISQDIDDFIQSLNLTLDTSSSGNYTKRVWAWFDEQSVSFSLDVDPGVGATDWDRTYVVRYNYLYKTWSIITLKDFRLQWGTSRFFSMNLNGLGDQANLSPIACLAGQNLTTSGVVAGLYDVPSYYKGDKPMNYSFGEPLGDWCDWSSVGSSTLIRPIFCNGETQWIDFGAENHVKVISGMSIASNGAEGFQIMYQIDNENDEFSDRNNAVWHEIGTIAGDYITFFRDFTSPEFNRIKFKVSGQALGRPIEIGQITFLTVIDQGYGTA